MGDLFVPVQQQRDLSCDAGPRLRKRLERASEALQDVDAICHLLKSVGLPIRSRSPPSHPTNHLSTIEDSCLRVYPGDRARASRAAGHSTHPGIRDGRRLLQRAAQLFRSAEGGGTALYRELERRTYRTVLLLDALRRHIQDSGLYEQMQRLAAYRAGHSISLLGGFATVASALCERVTALSCVLVPTGPRAVFVVGKGTRSQC